MRKKLREPPNVTKQLSHVILELYNIMMEPSNVRKKIREPLNVRKELSHVMLELHNVRMEPSPNMTKELSYVTKIEQLQCWYCLM